MAESEQIDIASILEKRKIPLIIGLLGLVLIIGGGFLIAISRQSEDKIEIIPAGLETTVINQKIKADIEGAVINPGVYELDSGSRVNDLLILAGGLSAQADREWVQATLNLAQKLTDGMKVFIPDEKEVGSGKVEAGTVKMDVGNNGAVAGQQTSALININTATATELDTLYGVGPATAQKIINNRPYQSIDELLSKKVVNKNIFDTMKDKISIY